MEGNRDRLDRILLLQIKFHRDRAVERCLFLEQSACDRVNSLLRQLVGGKKDRHHCQCFDIGVLSVISARRDHGFRVVFVCFCQKIALLVVNRNEADRRLFGKI